MDGCIGERERNKGIVLSGGQSKGRNFEKRVSGQEIKNKKGNHDLHNAKHLTVTMSLSAWFQYTFPELSREGLDIACRSCRNGWAARSSA